MHYTIDFHTHSIFSYDGGITKGDYEKVLTQRKLDMVAITDHHSIEYATYCQKKIGERILVGEEMTTKEGHLIGLFLNKTIPSGLSLEETVEKIHSQDGLVYVPHPFDLARHGIGERDLHKIKKEIDIVEFFNARIIFRFQNDRAKNFALAHNLAKAAGSDSHSASSLGFTYTSLPDMPTARYLHLLLKDSTYHTEYLPLISYFQPKWNRIKKRFFYEQ